MGAFVSVGRGMLRGMTENEDYEVVNFHYGDTTFRIKSIRNETWQMLADRYEEKAQAGGGFIDALTEKGGVTIYASPSIPAHFERPKPKREGVRSAVLA